MAVDKDEIDDIIDDNDGPAADVKEAPEKEAPKDIRGAIRHAIDHHAEDADVDQDKEPKEEKPKKEAKKAPVKATKEASEDEDQQDAGDDDINKPEVKEIKKLAAPPGWTKEGKAHWNTLPPDVQASVSKREKEFSEGIAKYATKAKAYDEMEQVIAPRRQAITQHGVTVPQTIDRLFQWMEALSHQDLNHRVNSFKALAQSFGVDISRLAPKSQINQDDNDADPQEPDPNQPPAWFQNYASQVDNKLQTVESQFVQQNQSAAQKFISTWAKDKPHFESVRQTMFQLIQSQIVPLKDGEIDLDGAYEKAVQLHPEVSAQVQQEAEERAEAEANAKAAQKAKETAARLKKAQLAGSGLKPSAPSIGSSSKPNGKANGSAKSESVRDSLRRSLDELRE